MVAVACLFTGYWLADLCADQGMPFGLGHALSMPAIHGGKATNDTIDAQQIAALLRGGMLPKASGSPAERRATRDLLRRRTPLLRQRADLFSPVHHTHSHENLPDLGKQRASQANRAGVAARVAAPAGPKHSEVALALSPSDAEGLADLVRSMMPLAKRPLSWPCSSVPGGAERVRLASHWPPGG